MNIDEMEARRLLAERAVRFVDEYPACWRRTLAAWQASASPASLWLLYAASYLFRTGGVRWAVDPIVPSKLLPGLPDDLPTAALARQSFLLLTHAHADHLDYRLLAALRGAPVRFVVPEFLTGAVQEHAHPGAGQLVVARPGERLLLDGIEILPFPGRHWEPRTDRRVGIDALGYLVQAGGWRWLFPGEVRDYRPNALAEFAPVDVLFAHLWLGRERALEPLPPLRDALCDFVIGCRPRTVVLTHLDEFSRAPEDLWTHRHADLVRVRLRHLNPDIRLLVPGMGEEVSL